jgi:hypothetical protein
MGTPSGWQGRQSSFESREADSHQQSLQLQLEVLGLDVNRQQQRLVLRAKRTRYRCSMRCSEDALI